MKKYNYLDIASFVEELMEKKESAEIEFKSAAGGFPKAFWETYSSFANTNGGTIVLGIKEKKVTMFASDFIIGRSTGAVCPLAAELPPR
jgi:predicted HTH transcriptional regulator